MTGWVWVAIAVGVVALGLAVAFGTVQWRRSRPNQRHPEVEAATKDVYRQDPR